MNYWKENVRYKIFISFKIVASTSQLSVRRKIFEKDDNKIEKFKMKQKNYIIENQLNNGNQFKKISNYDLNKNNNHIMPILNKNKEKNLLLNKQKHLFLINNFNKYSNDSGIINLKSLKGNNSNLNELKESFFGKYNKFGKELFKKDQKCISAFERMIITNKNNSQELNNNMQNLNKQTFLNTKINIKNYNMIDDSPSTSTFAFTKKYNSNSINKQNLTEDQNNKLRMGLLSAISNSNNNNNNNNMIAPLIPTQRPLSNFNLGGGQFWENINNSNTNNVINIKIGKNNKDLNNNKKLVSNINIIERNKINKEMRHKIGTAPSQKRSEFNKFLSNNDKEKQLMEKNYSNIFNNLNYGPKLHNIKIEKNLINNKWSGSANKNIFLKYMSLQQKKLPKINKNHSNSQK